MTFKPQATDTLGLFATADLPAHRWLRYPSLPHGLVQLITLGLNDVALQFEPPPEDLAIPLSPSQGRIGHYATPIALILAKPWRAIPGAIAHQLHEHLNQHWSTCLSKHTHLTQADLLIQVDAKHWIHFACSPALQLACLETALTPVPKQFDSPGDRLPIDSLSSDDDIFALQYAHARCQTWLRLALEHSQWSGHPKPSFNLATLNDITQNSISPESAELYLWRSLLNFPLSFVPSQRITLEAQKLTSHALPQVHSKLWLDPVPIPWPPTARCQRQLAQDWEKLFQMVHCQWAVLGETARRSPPLQSHRVSSILLLKRVLAFLLTEIYEVPAPQTL